MMLITTSESLETRQLKGKGEFHGEHSTHAHEKEIADVDLSIATPSSEGASVELM